MAQSAGDARRFIRSTLEIHGWTPTTRIVVLADGADGLTNLVQHATENSTRAILDWFHIRVMESECKIIYRHGMWMLTPSVGDHLKEWRQRRRLSQLDLATEANISPRHLSFVETGRSAPSREMIMHLAEQLQIPIRERNVLLVAAGYAPIFPERSLDDSPTAAARTAIDIVLHAHRPFPAFSDRRWNTVASNSALPVLYEA